MKFSWTKAPRPIIGLSPMADITDSAFATVVRQVASRPNKDAHLVIFKEMVSSEAIVRKNEKTLQMTKIKPTERPLIQQIFGSDPETMARAATIIVERHAPEGIDINMGCPVYKMISNFNGAALMKDPKLATKIVKKIKNAVSVPISVKIRAGWSDPMECLDFSAILEEAGADLISIHGRTQKQGYSGSANREVVKLVKKQRVIPIIYNGDIFSWRDYKNALQETGCDGALIARGALGNPWIFSQIENYLSGDIPKDVDINEKLRVAKLHLNEHLTQYGEGAITTFRKHFICYFKGMKNFKTYRAQLMTARTAGELETIFNRML